MSKKSPLQIPSSNHIKNVLAALRYNGRSTAITGMDANAVSLALLAFGTPVFALCSGEDTREQLEKDIHNIKSNNFSGFLYDEFSSAQKFSGQYTELIQRRLESRNTYFKQDGILLEVKRNIQNLHPILVSDLSNLGESFTKAYCNTECLDDSLTRRVMTNMLVGGFLYLSSNVSCPTPGKFGFKKNNYQTSLANKRKEFIKGAIILEKKYDI